MRHSSRPHRRSPKLRPRTPDLESASANRSIIAEPFTVVQSLSWHTSKTTCPYLHIPSFSLPIVSSPGYGCRPRSGGLTRLLRYCLSHSRAIAAAPASPAAAGNDDRAGRRRAKARPPRSLSSRSAWCLRHGTVQRKLLSTLPHGHVCIVLVQFFSVSRLRMRSTCASLDSTYGRRRRVTWRNFVVSRHVHEIVYGRTAV